MKVQAIAQGAGRGTGAGKGEGAGEGLGAGEREAAGDGVSEGAVENEGWGVVDAQSFAQARGRTRRSDGRVPALARGEIRFLTPNKKSD